MEWLIAARNVIVEGVKGNWIGLTLVVAPFILPNKMIYTVGRGIGWTATTFLRQKAGKKRGEAAESYFQGTLNAFTTGINDGLDADDSV